EGDDDPAARSGAVAQDVPADRATGCRADLAGRPMTLLARDPAAPLTLGPSRVLRRQRLRRGVDGWLLVTALVLALIGAVLVWSATKSRLADERSNPQGYLYRHLGNIGIGIALAVIAARVDVRRLPLLGPLLYLGSLPRLP